MARPKISPSGKEITWSEKDIIVSKTDPKGIITYANRTFCQVSGYSAEELVGQNHNIIRHPAMPQSVFKFLWDNISTGAELFAYVLNQARNGDEYWVLAHVTPNFDRNKNIIGYHSSRRVPKPAAVEAVKGLYKIMLDEEKKHSNPKEGMTAATNILVGLLTENKVDYGEFILSL
ncbi:MAG: PAS domain-containing protein [Rhodospirillales bacterium]|nr:PAS domain-containing protein [Rhodospirillales bacterium]